MRRSVGVLANEMTDFVFVWYITLNESKVMEMFSFCGYFLCFIVTLSPTNYLYTVKTDLL